MSTVPQLKNSADDEDFIQALEEVESIDADRDDAKEAHRAKMATFREAKKRKIKMLCTELGMDRDVFEAMLADRAEDRAYQAKKAERAQKMPDAKTEMFLDALGQYSWLPAPEDGAKPETPAERAARERIAAIQKITDDDQDLGNAVLEEMASGSVAH
tara:strand:- start:3248 stop:3721 length:474 start_codon:yes stop_codon:yes gene_type:complete